MKRREGSLVVMMGLAVVLGACGPRPMPTPNPTEQFATAVALVQQATATALARPSFTPTLAPTLTSTTTALARPTFTPTPALTPTPTATAMPAATPTRTAIPSPSLPKPEDLVVEYNEEMRPLILRLLTAQELPAGFQLPKVTQWRIIPVPLSERLFHTQEILFPKLQLGKPDAPVKAYIAYDYERGTPLGRSLFGLAFSADTQEVISEVRLVAEVDGKFYLVEGRKGEGGAGSSSYEELVSKSVEKLDSLGDVGEELESVLETIIGYAAGLDWDESFELNRRLAVLMWALSSENWADRKQAAEALGDIGPEEGVVPALIKALGDEDSPVRKEAAWALAGIGPEAKEAVPALIKALGDEDPSVRMEAAWALALIGPEEGVVLALIKALGDEDFRVRERVAGALGHIGPEAKEAVPALIEALGDEDSRVRWRASRALGDIGPEAKEAIPGLIKTLGDEDSSAREEAAGALGKIGPEAKEAVPALIKALGDGDEDVRRAAALTLKAITGQDFGEDASRWQQWWEAQK